MIRPFKEPATKRAMEEFWNPDDQSLEDAKRNRENSGRGAFGPVDPDLSKDIEKLKKEK
jgi:hypothetical protein